MLITPEYAALYKELYSKEQYGIGGKRWADKADVYLKAAGVVDALDYGAGKGTLSSALRARGYSMDEYEPAIEGKDTPPLGNYDAVVTTDVLEHVEPELVDDVLDYIADRSDRLFAVIATRPGVRMLPDGSNPHRSVHPADWWLDQLDQRYDAIVTVLKHPRELAVWCSK